MTRYPSLSILHVGKKKLFFGFVLFQLCAILPTGDAQISPFCTSFDSAGDTISLQEGQDTTFIIYAWDIKCEDPVCQTANTSCSSACAGCTTFNAAANLKDQQELSEGKDEATEKSIVGEGFNGSAIPGLNCSVGDSTTPGQWPATCLATNDLAGRSGYTLVLFIMDGSNLTLGTKTANISFVAGDVVIEKCIGLLDNGTNKAYLNSDNVLQIFLMDNWNNTVGAKSGRPGIAPIPFNVTVTWNPDDGAKVTLSQPPVVDTRGDNGYYTALILPTRVGNYLAKIGVNNTMILNSPIAFQGVKGKRASANFLRPLFFKSGVRGFFLAVLYTAVVTVTTGTLM